MPFNQTLMLRIAAGVLWLLGTIFILVANTDFHVSLKDGAFERVLQARLPVRSNIHGVAFVSIDRVIVDYGPELKIRLEGSISDRKAVAPYSVVMGYRIELVDKGVHFVSFMPDQKIDGHDFTVAQELLPDLFEVLSTKPIYTVKKTGLIGLRVSEVKVAGSNIRITIAGFEVLELALAVLLGLGGGLIWRLAKRPVS